MSQYSRLAFQPHRRWSGAAFLTALGVISILAFATAQHAPATAQNPKETVCLSNLKQISLAIRMYTQDYDERLPLLTSTGKFQNIVFPYIKNRSVYICPVTNAAYQPVAALSGKLVEKIKRPAETIVIRDAKPHPSGTGGVVYVDGHTKLLKSLPATGGKK